MINYLKFNRFCFSKKKFFHKCNLPYLLHNQIGSYNSFLSSKYNSLFSIKKVLKQYFPLICNNKNIFIKLKKIELLEPCNTEKYTKIRNLHLFSTLYMYISIYVINKNLNVYKKIFLGNIPSMTKKGNFIINGIDRILISQFTKSYGIYFYTEKKKKKCIIIPLKGSWLEFIITNNFLIVFDKKINFEINVFLICLGYNKKYFFNFFFFKIKIKIIRGKKRIFFLLNKKKYFYKIYNKYICISIKKILGKLFGKNYFLKKNTFLKFNIIDINKVNLILNYPIYFFFIIFLKKIINLNYLIYIYKNFKLKINKELLQYKKGYIINFFRNLFYKKKYFYSLIGAKRIFKRLFLKKNNKLTIYLEIIKKILKFIKFNIQNDNFDNLENKLILNCGKLLSIKFDFLFKKVIKFINYKMNNFKKYKDLDFIVNSDIITIGLKDYFCNNELSQFLDQNNPLAEISHNRKISLISGIGIEKENCGFDIRDIHYSHYCKVCPIDTPEGHNIGLINSLAYLSKVNKYNFISTIYKISILGKILGITFLDNKFDKHKFIVNFNSTIETIYGEIFRSPYFEARKTNYYYYKKFLNIDLIEICGDQIISVGASLIPFLSHNDANRCLMGSNMQRQAVPLIDSENPIVGTGNELEIGLNSNYNILSDLNGYVLYSDNYKIIIKNNNFIKTYFLEKYTRTNQNTILNQYTKVLKGDFVKVGNIIADSNSTKNGEISLGKNLRVAFMSWYGYNFEDSILLSSSILNKNNFNSIHIYEFITVLKYNENGFEIVSNECFGSNEKIKNKVKNGIIKIGEFVFSKDVIVGKMIPKKKRKFSPEEKLFKIVFSESNFNYYEQPLTVPKNIKGTIIAVNDFKIFYFKNKIFKLLKFEQLNYTCKNINNFFYETFNYYLTKIKKLLFNNKITIKKKRINSYNININNIFKIKCFNKKINFKLNIFKNIISNELLKKKNIFVYKKINFIKHDDFENSIIRIIKIKIAVKKQIAIGDKMSGRHGNKGVVSNIIDYENMPYDKFGNKIDLILNPLGVPSRMNVGQLLEVFLAGSLNLIKSFFLKIKNLNKISYFKMKLFIKIIFKCIYDKNINLNIFNNSLVLKIFKNIKNQLNVCVHNFYNFNVNKVNNIIKTIGINKNCELLLFDGITGKRYLQLVNVGYIYFMKLNHLVIDKIYSRSIGPYSIVTQQPLGGKSNLGGQRLGEMEVWALEAYGAAFLLKEMLTIKSDDILGRIELYKNIIKGINDANSGIPESFQVLMKEIQSLCFDIKIL
ncbi:RNA polymerase beta subunit [Candidatus Carsonella ruddii PV]|uniref:DNA-directed RNA polymerase subunit beta n=1 Tax=Carsonella ruddii (strain PV) TaxID=387662 RepID=RPOB_CARRP|nr:DNA-directed RNA polymerase subunit beta [Candidatus Carsonella ruddii]Q05FH8.1 RecName: Full=DNA-directed RNA polymerase subunit beta; Short=RNAP subunit beta; AltName: Full=RNA polymerase subunit beta; AltName: Full=Transcriptase subunit beta [Candidatus Carsonella ruddii PV]BAF35193.1 RNA polymerase beta subunit [Candidatus Carsonella ruddii PV]